MDSTIVSLISILVLCITTSQGRNTLKTAHEFSTSSLVTNNGICKTMVETQGYTCEEHKVTTEDGYILSLQRIPAGRSCKKADKPPVLIQHGIFCAYWDWSWDELANYDLPASIQYVYNHTGKKIHFAGHSQGTLMAFVALSQGKLLNMLRSAALLSPIAYMNPNPSKEISLVVGLFLTNEVYWSGLYQFIPNMDVATKFVNDICNTLNLDLTNLLALFTGPNCCLNSSRLDVYLDHVPQPTSTKNLIHFSQMTRTGKIAKYDYVHQAQNLLHYGQLTPPTYDMTKIPTEFPLFLGVGEKDMLSDLQDVKLLLNDLNGHDYNKKVVFLKDYAHIDFIAAINAKQVVYDHMIAFLNAN